MIQLIRRKSIEGLALVLLLVAPSAWAGELLYRGTFNSPHPVTVWRSSANRLGVPAVVDQDQYYSISFLGGTLGTIEGFDVLGSRAYQWTITPPIDMELWVNPWVGVMFRVDSLPPTDRRPLIAYDTRDISYVEWLQEVPEPPSAVLAGVALVGIVSMGSRCGMCRANGRPLA